MFIVADVQRARSLSKQILLHDPWLGSFDPRHLGVSVRSIVEVVFSRVSQGDASTAPDPPQWKPAFLLQQHTQGSPKRRPLRIAAIVLPDAREEACPTVRLVQTIRRDADIEKGVAIDDEAPISRNSAKVPGVDPLERSAGDEALRTAERLNCLRGEVCWISVHRIRNSLSLDKLRCHDAAYQMERHLSNVV